MTWCTYFSDLQINIYNKVINENIVVILNHSGQFWSLHVCFNTRNRCHKLSSIYFYIYLINLYQTHFSASFHLIYHYYFLIS